jgi:hypothetical protein
VIEEAQDHKEQRKEDDHDLDDIPPSGLSAKKNTDHPGREERSHDNARHPQKQHGVYPSVPGSVGMIPRAANMMIIMMIIITMTIMMRLLLRSTARLLRLASETSQKDRCSAAYFCRSWA